MPRHLKQTLSQDVNESVPVLRKKVFVHSDCDTWARGSGAELGMVLLAVETCCRLLPLRVTVTYHCSAA